jgi:hypothetical protein
MLEYIKKDNHDFDRNDRNSYYNNMLNSGSFSNGNNILPRPSIDYLFLQELTREQRVIVENLYMSEKHKPFFIKNGEYYYFYYTIEGKGGEAIQLMMRANKNNGLMIQRIVQIYRANGVEEIDDVIMRIINPIRIPGRYRRRVTIIEEKVEGKVREGIEERVEIEEKVEGMYNRINEENNRGNGRVEEMIEAIQEYYEN